MGEGDKKDDLFEDLDKFFAPIQDVDWPETTRPAEQPEASGLAEGEREERTETEGAGEEEAVSPGEPKEEREALFAEEGPEAAPGAEEEGLASTLYETEEYEVEAAAEEPGYVEFPAGPEAEGEGEVEGEAAELEEEPLPEEPSIEAVEAAAEHFAESVREAVEAEAEAEEATLPELLGAGEAEGEIGALEEEEEPVRTVVVGPEGLGGPSWQEPTTVEVGSERERAAAGKNVPAAFLTGLVLAALAIGAIAIGKGPFAIVASIIVLWAQGELYLAMQKRNRQPATALGLVSGALVLGAAYFEGEAAILAMFALSVFATFLWYMVQPAAHRKNITANIGLTILGVAYVPLLASYGLAMLRPFPDSRGLVLAVVGLTVVYDTAAFVVGYFWGSRPLSPTISPKKSWEGALGATLVVIAVAIGVVAPAVDLLDTIGRSVGLAVVVAIFAPLGDLAESLIKRDLGLKDMGSILPGHGGVMDRIDSVLFVAPAAFLFLRLILL